MKKVSFHTLGCKVNFAETSTLARGFASAGFERVGEGAAADVCVINSCSVTAHADKKCRNLIGKLRRLSPRAVIVVTGCYAQLQPEAVGAIEGVDFVFGNNFKSDIVGVVTAALAKKGVESDATEIKACPYSEIDNFFGAWSAGDRTRAFLKVQDGCDYRCAYCTIHYARGHSRNIPIARAVEEARQIASRGIKEIVVTGINTGDFGRTTGESFIDLLRALDTVEGIERYRISSIEPNLLSDKVIDFCARSTKFQPHFHIPLQSGSDRILGLMRRRYTTARFAERVERVREVMPDTFFGIDVIVGFPGETDDDFETTYRFLEKLAPAYLHVFPFSERPGTPAVDLPDKVPPRVTAERAARLGELCQRLHRQFAERFVGTEAVVLFEGSRKDGMMSGFTGNYIKVSAPYDAALVNTLVPVTLSREQLK
ncbi:MAG: tRNA (N(6)-L-threonylcarbamoyladenosine(37)-C(2))-methylthiotransferase MtaB [Rikenellaceae bacterium]|jgi:threonylcarbamoyladenosine tRNA methylthiotransferase MtaB|nr:tRNA (N(6)-L-threonylcarbamoyladenosine(37)-C(2))-methylthiotransferase MtaB [Rikenellaceae bacterium]